MFGQDPWQIKNLANDPEYASVLKKHRQHLEEWIQNTGDPGPESVEVYIIETDDQLRGKRQGPYYENTQIYLKWF
ncbi:MAG: hypothetical protein MK132_26825 [Lentisphaerales bacterium]|nr:hypothetical protein [Lentisphaerales bacterium]